MINVNKFDIGITASNVMGACMVRAWVVGHSPALNTVSLRLESGAIVSGLVCFSGQYWLYNDDVAYFDGRSSGDTGTGMLPYGAPVLAFTITMDGARRYYVVGIDKMKTAFFPPVVPLAWPYIPLSEFFVIGTGVPGDNALGDHLGFPYIAAAGNSERDPFDLVNTFTDASGTLKSKGTAYAGTYLDSAEKVNCGKIVRTVGSNYVMHFPYEWCSMQRFDSRAFYPTPVVQEPPGGTLYGRQLGVFMCPRNSADPYASGSELSCGIALDRIPFAIASSRVPARIAVASSMDNSNDVRTFFVVIEVGLRDPDSPYTTTPTITMYSYRLDGEVSINTMLTEGVVDAAVIAEANGSFHFQHYYTSSLGFWGTTLAQLSFQPLVTTSTIQMVCTVFCGYLGEGGFPWILPGPDPEDLADYSIVKTSTRTVTIDPLLPHGFSVSDETIATASNQWLKLSAITLEIPYVGVGGYHHYYREDFDSTRQVVVYPHSAGDLTMSVSGYWEHDLLEPLDLSVTTNVAFTEEWDVDQAIIYKFDGAEVCREIKQCTASASGTHVHPSINTRDVISCTFTRESNVTVREIIWVHLFPEFSTFIFWECDIFTNASYEDATFADATYRLCLWIDGTKTTLRTVNKAVAPAEGKAVLDPVYYIGAGDTIRHDAVYEDRGSGWILYGCGVPRWQLIRLGGYPSLYTGTKDQIPQAVLDEHLDTVLNVAWRAATQSRSMFMEFKVVDFGMSYTWEPSIDPPEPGNRVVLNYNVGRYPVRFSFTGDPQLFQPPHSSATPIVGIKSISAGGNIANRLGMDIRDLMIGQLLDGVYVRIKPYGTTTWIEHFSGTPSRLAALRSAYNDSSIPFAFWAR